MEQERQQEIRGLFQILEQTAEIADESLLTENYKDSESRCISQFNKVLQRLIEINAVPKELFDPLQEDASFSEISIACNHLAAYLSEGLGTSSDLKGMMTNILGKNIIDNISDELKEGRIGDLIRSAMPDFLTETTLDDINESFSASSDGTMIIDADLGSIDIRGADTDVVNVVVHRAAQLKTDRHAAEILKEFHVTFNQQDNELHINAKFKEGKRYWSKAIDRFGIHFDITVPQTYHSVLLKSAGGDISVTELNGNVRCRTNSGKLHFEKITGPIVGHTDNGDVRLMKCEGDIRITTLRGYIEINENVGSVDTTTSGGHIRCADINGTLNAETSGGNIKIINSIGGANVESSGGDIDVENNGPITAKAFGGSIKVGVIGQLQKDSIVETSGGDITISLIPDIVVRVDAKSNGGEITSDLPIDTSEQDPAIPWHLKGSINGDGPLLKLRGIGGDINLKCKNSQDNAG